MQTEVGNIYVLRVPLLNNHRGSLGVCYKKLDGEILIVFANGESDSFDPYEKVKFLFHCGESQRIKDYTCLSEEHMQHDFAKGVFDHVWEGSFQTFFA